MTSHITCLQSFFWPVYFPSGVNTATMKTSFALLLVFAILIASMHEIEGRVRLRMPRFPRRFRNMGRKFNDRFGDRFNQLENSGYNQQGGNNKVSTSILYIFCVIYDHCVIYNQSWLHWNKYSSLSRWIRLWRLHTCLDLCSELEGLGTAHRPSTGMMITSTVIREAIIGANVSWF